MRSFLISLVVFAITLQSGCGDPKSNEIPDNKTLTVEKTGGIVVNDIGIAKFTTPKGWSSNRSNKNTAVILTRSNSNRQNRDEMISIDIGTPVSPNVKASADGFAKKFAGDVSLLSFAVDGETAYRVSIPPNYTQTLPRECIVVHHRGKVCFLIAGSKSKDDIWPALLAIAKSWKWN